MTNQGFIIIPRRLLDWHWYSNANVRLVFLDLLVRAAWCDLTYQGVQLRRGQAAISVPDLATRNQLSIQQTRSILAKLKSTGEITVERNPKFSIITLNSYDELQGFNAPDDSQSTVNCSQTQHPDGSNINAPTYNNNKTIKTIKTNKQEQQTPAARVVNKNFYSKKNCSQSQNSSFDVNEVVERIKARRYSSSDG